MQTVHVSVGQAINEGDKLVSLEAMKMVTHVVARRGGKVTSIAVKPGRSGGRRAGAADHRLSARSVPLWNL